MDLVTIDGVNYDVCVMGIEENFNVLDSDKSGRSISGKGRMIREVIGTFVGHKVKFQRKASNIAAYDNLFNTLMKPVDSHTVKIVHGQTTITYEAYVTAGKRNVQRIDGSKVMWGELEVDFTPMEAYQTPT